MHAVVALGGDADPTHVRGVLRRANMIIAADGGAAHVQAAGGVCDVIVGDMDSVCPETLDQARNAGADIRDFPTAKDATDGELALQEAVSRGATSITIVGALGGPRVDHLLANVALLAHPSLRRLDAVIEDASQRLWLVTESSTWRGRGRRPRHAAGRRRQRARRDHPGSALCPAATARSRTAPASASATR